jgi:hypothetical protein
MLKQEHKQVIKIIGDLTEWNHALEISGVEQELVARLASFYSIQDVSDVLMSLGVYKLVDVSDPTSQVRRLKLTTKGSQVYEAITGLSGWIMPHEYREIGLKTVLDKDIDNRVSFVETFFENWMGNLVHWLGDALHAANALENNLFFCYLATQTSVFDSLAHNLLVGSYDIVLKELRTILEGLFLAYGLETNNLTASLDDKLAMMEELEKQGHNHGKTVFKNSGLEGWEDHYDVYRELCTYVHISRKVTGERVLKIAKDGFSEIIGPVFDIDAFKRCLDAWEKVANLVVILTNALLKCLNINDSSVSVDIFY